VGSSRLFALTLFSFFGLESGWPSLGSARRRWRLHAAGPRKETLRLVFTPASEASHLGWMGRQHSARNRRDSGRWVADFNAQLTAGRVSRCLGGTTLTSSHFGRDLLAILRCLVPVVDQLQPIPPAAQA